MTQEVTPTQATIPAEGRDQILNAEVAKYVGRGYSVQSVAQGQAVLSKNKRMGWFWNTVLVLLTGGLWFIYIIYRALNRKNETVIITVDVFGKVRIK